MGIFFILASFVSPIEVNVDPKSMLWMLPLAAAIAVVYKATKLPEIAPVALVKQSVILFGSIVAMMIIAAIVLYGITAIIVR